MKQILTGSQMKACDRETIAYYGVSSPVLMERAALACVDMLMQHFDVSAHTAQDEGTDSRRQARMLALCGCGNNGGDGVAIARILKERGIGCDVCMTGVETENGAVADASKEKLSADCLRQYETAVKYGVRGIGLAEALAALAGHRYDIVIDAMFGVGLSRPLNERYCEIVHAVNTGGVRVLAVDMPTGIHADSGAVMGDAVQADVTVTFAFYKRGQLLYPGRDFCGTCIAADIGITAHALSRSLKNGAADGKDAVSFCYEPDDLKRLPARSNASNKGTYGRVLLAAGSREICGAAYLSGAAAYKTGAGLVQLLSEETNRTALQTMLPEALLAFYREGDKAEAAALLKKALDWASVAAVGPGIGKSDTARRLLRETLTECGASGKPVVIDADGLNLLAEDMTPLADCGAPVVVTPHMAEMSRLTGAPVAALKKDPVAYASAFAKKYDVVCVLKDACTVVCDGKDGIYINTSGNNGMSTGGAGDVLTGIIAGLLAQHTKLFEAACMGVYVHGLAGDAAAGDTGVYGLTARRLLAGLEELI